VGWFASKLAKLFPTHFFGADAISNSPNFVSSSVSEPLSPQHKKVNSPILCAPPVPDDRITQFLKKQKGL
jgi:hypothetical protein